MGAAIEIVLDCADPDAMADFWVAALRYERHGVAANYRSLVDPAGVGPKFILQGVDEPKAAKNRMHLDVLTDDVDVESARLEALGARRLRPAAVEEHGMRWIVMADPEGNEFCVCQC